MNINRKIKTLFVLGVLVILLPVTGFPDNWKTIFSIIFGLTICYIAYRYYLLARAEAQTIDANKPKAGGTEMFVENSIKAE